MAGAEKYRFLLVQALRRASSGAVPPGRESQLMNYAEVAPFLDGIAWDLHPGPASLNEFGAVESREEFALIGARRLPIVREACESGKYSAIVLLGGGDPGFLEAREIGHAYGIPVTSCAHAQMHVAEMLGGRFSVLDVAELHNMRMRDAIVQYGFADRCASIRNISFHLPRPSNNGAPVIEGEMEKALHGQPSPMLEAATREVEAAIEEDGAEVMMIGCSAAYWMQPFLQRRLQEVGWSIPILEGYRCAILQAKLLVDLGIDASGLAFPTDRPRRWRRRKLV
jgi:Asp/Glu/hydantoin racemase